MMPTADATSEETFEPSKLVGLTQIKVLDCWRLRRIAPVAETSLTQSDSSRILVCAGFLKVWRWGSRASARGSIQRLRKHPDLSRTQVERLGGRD